MATLIHSCLNALAVALVADRKLTTYTNQKLPNQQMTLDDEQLDDLLRQIEVPSGLKASLRTIPDRTDRNVEVDTFPTSKSWTALLGTVAALAASVVLYLALSPNLTSNPGGVAGGIGGSSEIAMLLAEMEQDNESIDTLLQLQETRLSFEPESEPIFDSNESVATALSLSWQAAIDRGASVDSVREELQYVVNQFPNTTGAQLAQGLLQIN